ncbi:fatty acid CoA ligase family protein [Ferruginibacter paludis]|uniref:fatty acid CoA ligase family protein n=1 Tax=Ferruginibacter paludis TaxID=1310417 RepID=UPI0025B32871|nr:fatty acid CoA ligase family protein [Ferruginibacter paludis]MDN3658654.1 fatty acid CoA ligase family protein [Ferruginibacter paludis]
MKPFNIASALLEMAETQPAALAIAFPEKNSLDKNGITRYQKITFKELAFETACVARGLLAAGFERGDRVVMMVPPGFDFFILGFSMLQTGIIPIFIDPGIGKKNLKECIAETEPVGFIGISKAHAARVLLGWGKKTISKTVTIGLRLFWGGKEMQAIRNFDRSQEQGPFFDAGPDDLAAIIFTSGSTGLAKGVVYSHGNFRAQLEMIRDTFGFSPGEIDMPTFAPFALFNPALGMSSIIPDMDPTKPAFVNPLHIIAPIKQFGITNIFGSPALIDTVGRYGEAKGVKLPSLKRVISAGAPASVKALIRFSSMLMPDIEIFTPYGATESMPVATIGSHYILRETQEKTGNGYGVCIGKPVEGVEIEIIRISDEVIPNWSEYQKVAPGEIGEIVVKGCNVTRSYFNRKNATKLAKIRDGNVVRHRMGDLGYFDAEGNLWFCGRKAHRVKVGEQELYSIQCEYIFNKHPDVFRTALVGVNGEAVLCVEPEKSAIPIDQAKLKVELLAWAAAHPLTGAIQTLLFHPGFPVDFRHNAKIIREKLAVWAKNELA